jgi:hypothetical protein
MSLEARCRAACSDRHPVLTFDALRPVAHSLSLVVCLAGSACLPTRTQRLGPQTGDSATPPAIVVDGSTAPGDAPTLRPHAVLGIDPPHGPFAGGTLVAVRGNGFSSNARIWFADQEVSSDQVLVLDPQRMQVTSPPGSPGASDVTIQNGDDESTRSSLVGGFTYDDFYLDPVTGPTAGGTLVTIHAAQALFDETTSVEVDLAPCELDTLTSPTELTCRTPPGTPGAKRVRVTSADAQNIDVLDAFTYVIDDTGFRGGISGDPVDGQMQVVVLDDAAGLAIPGATVLAGTSADSALTTQTDGFGTALLASPDLGPKVTVTVAKACFQPQTFIDVPAQKLTVFLQPILSPACGDSGSIPAGGGTPGKSSSVSGQLVWPLNGELMGNGFGNVPPPMSDSVKQVAYVFRLGSKPTDAFSLPSAVSAVTPDTSGDVGYNFYLSTPPGNFTLYALAGLEDRSSSPYVFTPYALGLTRGVAVGPSDTHSDVFISVNLPLDHALSIDAAGPTPTSRGPDRVDAKLAIQIGSEGYVLLPNGKLSSLLPTEGPFRFVGIPPLSGPLSGSSYVATATAVTGAAEGTPLSAVGLFATVADDTTIGVGAFLELPQLKAPGSSAVWNRSSFELSRAAGGPTPDLTLLDVSSSDGLVTWRIVAPGGPARIEVPDLGAVEADLGFSPGPLAIDVHLATIDDFSYASLSSKQLTPKGWRAYAEDVFFASY